MVEYTSSQYSAKTGTTTYFDSSGKAVSEKEGKFDESGKSVVRIAVEPTSSGTGIKSSKPITSKKDVFVSQQLEAKQTSVNATQNELRTTDNPTQVRVIGDTQTGEVKGQYVTGATNQYVSSQIKPQDFSNPLTPSLNAATGITSSKDYDPNYKPYERKDKGFESPYTAPFFSFKGQKQRFSNTIKTYGAVGKRFYNTITFKDQDVGIKVNRDFEASDSRAVRIAGRTASFIGNKPLTTASVLTTGRYVYQNPKSLLTAAKGSAAISGVGAVGYGIARGQAKNFLSVEDSKGIQSRSADIQASKASKFNIAYQISPVFSSKKTKAAYTQNVYNELRSKGYSDKEASELTKEAYRYRQISGVTAGTQQLIAGATAERIGRSGYSKSGIGGIYPAGFYEGFSGSLIQDKVESKSYDFSKAATIGSFGAATATGFSYGVIKFNRGAVVGNVLDLSEYPSDKLADFGSLGGRKTRVLTLTPAVSTSTNVKTNTNVNTKAKNFEGFKAEGFTLTQKPKVSTNVFSNTNKISASTSFNTATSSNIRGESLAQTSTDTKALTSSQTNTFTDSFINVGARSSTTTKVSPLAQTQTQAQTTTNTRVGSFVFTPNIPLIPFIPKGSGNSFSKTKKSPSSSQLKGITPTFTAASLGLKGKTTKKSLKTGLGFRGV